MTEDEVGAAIAAAAEAEGDEAIEPSAETVMREIVDGQPAIIDGTVPPPEPLVPVLTIEQALNAVSAAQEEYDAREAEADSAKARLKAAESLLDRTWQIALDVHRKAKATQMALGER